MAPSQYVRRDRPAFISSFASPTALASSFLGAPAVTPGRPTAPAAALPARSVVRAMQNAGGGGGGGDGARAGPPPDLPSLLLHNRIIYLGMSLVPAVTELIIAEFLYLQYEDPDKPVYMYINSTGTSSPDGQNVGFETEAFAIADTMNYVKMPVHTICVGQAFGMAAMLLANGDKGNRSCLPNATIMLHQPRGSAQGPASDIAIKAKEVLFNRRQSFEIISEKSGQPVEQIEKDAARTRYLTPDEAVEYGIVDKVLRSEKDLPQKAPAFLSALDK
jgi:ATP-dependent Clp protease, protease subunit